ncbi:protogenin [Caerostris extrusa]|uniref:Protogenin n=1 Tax=Caerostris extrusa TaxID=172846 RepID=A0AAV4XYB5_CAEEX|nr:protogenin [Caerostris extrusa]
MHAYCPEVPRWKISVRPPRKECGFSCNEKYLRARGGSLKLSLSFSALSPPEVVILRNHPLLLNCSGHSEEGPLQINWKYHDVTIRDKHFQILSNGSLYIEKTVSQKKRERRWDGNYTCLLKNRVGSIASRPIRMSKTFTSEPQPLTTHEGGQARFSCQIFAVPPADILWYTFLPSGTLQITGVTLSDAGDYKCHCSNIARQRNSTDASLTVLPRVEQFQPPVFLSPGEEVTAIANKPAVLECLADGFPTVELSWKKEDGEEIPDNFLKSGNLYFPKVQPNHSGATKILKVPSSQIIPTAQTVRFDCEVDSIPAASIQWLKDVTTDSGIYQCVASNVAGTTTASARLQVNASSDQPQPPSGLKAFTMSSSAIVLSFGSQFFLLPSAPIQAYTVHYVPSNGAYSNKSASEPSQPIVQMTGEDVRSSSNVANEYTITGLIPKAKI